MKPRTLLSALAVLVAATTVSFAQSMPNYGPNAPATGDSLGKPPSGTRPPGVTRSQRSNYQSACTATTTGTITSGTNSQPPEGRGVKAGPAGRLAPARGGVDKRRLTNYQFRQSS
jgi:hypothetical protein